MHSQHSASNQLYKDSTILLQLKVIAPQVFCRLLSMFPGALSVFSVFRLQSAFPGALGALSVCRLLSVLPGACGALSICRLLSGNGIMKVYHGLRIPFRFGGIEIVSMEMRVNYSSELSLNRYLCKCQHPLCYRRCDYLIHTQTPSAHCVCGSGHVLQCFDFNCEIIHE